LDLVIILTAINFSASIVRAIVRLRARRHDPDDVVEHSDLKRFDRHANSFE
jgi:hypothetical protein